LAREKYSVFFNCKPEGIDHGKLKENYFDDDRQPDRRNRKYLYRWNYNRQIGAAVWALPFGRHHFGAHRFGDKTYGRRDKCAQPFRRRTFRRWTTKSSHVKW